MPSLFDRDGFLLQISAVFRERDDSSIWQAQISCDESTSGV
jgi:hypothetical protein